MKWAEKPSRKRHPWHSLNIVPLPNGCGTAMWAADCGFESRRRNNYFCVFLLGFFFGGGYFSVQYMYTSNVKYILHKIKVSCIANQQMLRHKHGRQWNFISLNIIYYYIRLYFTVFLLARSNTRDIPFSNILISKKQFLCNK